MRQTTWIHYMQQTVTTWTQISKGFLHRNLYCTFWDITILTHKSGSGSGSHILCIRFCDLQFLSENVAAHLTFLLLDLVRLIDIIKDSHDCGHTCVKKLVKYTRNIVYRFKQTNPYAANLHFLLSDLVRLIYILKDSHNCGHTCVDSSSKYERK